jgi:hypothetical protein
VGAGGSGAITFGASVIDPTLVVDAADTPANGGTFANALTNLGDNDNLDIRGLAFVAGQTSATLSGSDLAVTNGTTTIHFTLSGTTAAHYYAYDDGAGHVLVNDNPACFLAGSRILTDRGPVAVEDLQVGDLAMTLSGKGAPLKPIVWIGRARFDAGRHPRPEQVWPIRIVKDAFGPGLPRRDLLVSPDHAFPIDGRLFPAMVLVNGATILQDRTITRGVYFHIELDRHDLVLAEGLPTETYLECNNRHTFDGQPGFKELYPDFTEWRDDSVDFVLPLTRSGDALAAARAKLQAQAEALGCVLTDDGRAIAPDSPGHRLVSRR